MRRWKSVLGAGLFLFVPHLLAAESAVRFLVFPLENVSRSQSLAWIGEGVCMSLTEQLRVPGAEVFTREERMNFVEGADLPPNATLSRASMIHVAQQVGAGKLIMGFYSGTAESLKISLRVLDLNTLKLGGTIVSNGPLAALPQMENELAWIILSDCSLVKVLSRDQFRARTRTVPNAAFALFIQSLGSREEADKINLLGKAVELYPEFSEAQSRLGHYFYQQGNCPDAIRHLTMAGTPRDGFVQEQFLLGNCYLKQNDYANAIRAYSAIESFVTSAQALNNSGVANMLKGDYTLAGQSLIEARNLDKADPTIGLNLAIVRHLQGNDSAARDLLEEMGRIHPNLGMFPFLLSLVLNAQGDTEGSAAALSQAQGLGIDAEKLRNENPQKWARIFSSWNPGR